MFIRGYTLNYIDGHLRLLEKVIYNNIRAILLVYKTTLIIILFKEASIPSLEIKLNLCS
jgi:hypothetical protein